MGWMLNRMRSGAVAWVLVVQACAPGPTLPPMVCADAGVLQQVDEIIRADGRAMVLEAAPVGEVSTTVTTPPLAHCAARGHTFAYDTNRYGTSPVHVPFTVRYTVEARHNGLFVAVD